MKRLAALLIAVATLATACQGNVFNMAVGDCFNDPDSLEVSSVEMKDCTEAHDNEVYLLYDIAGSSFPGQSAVTDDASQRCVDGFVNYVGVDYWTSMLEVSFLTPTSESWGGGDREVICYLYDPSGTPMTISARNSNL